MMETKKVTSAKIRVLCPKYLNLYSKEWNFSISKKYRCFLNLQLMAILLILYTNSKCLRALVEQISWKSTERAVLADSFQKYRNLVWVCWLLRVQGKYLSRMFLLISSWEWDATVGCIPWQVQWPLLHPSKYTYVQEKLHSNNNIVAMLWEKL